MQSRTGLAVADKELFDQLKNVSHHDLPADRHWKARNALRLCDRSLRPPHTANPRA
jgi:hypothetical protein